MDIPWKRLAAYLGIIGGIQFIIITAIIMVIYPPPGYNFLLNTFSSLGLTVTNSVPTPHHHILFSLACTLAAICIVPFLLALRTLFTDSTTLVILSWVGTIFGILAAPFLSALAIFAGDVFPSQHGTATQLFFLCISLAILIYSIAMLIKSDFSNLYALIGFIIAILCFTYLAGIITHLPIISSAAMQKVAVYGIILWSAFQGYYLLKVFPE
jgi:hypothetical protein